jgi:crotonobetainyl-CoA:carnitine CoA-transferase CaiB-like acyl-CoA transferase
LVGSPLKFAEAQTSYRRPPPMLGQHSDEVLRELGFADDQIATLRKEGVV